MPSPPPNTTLAKRPAGDMKSTSRRELIKKAASRVSGGAKTAGKALARVGAAGGRMAVAATRRGGRAVVRAAKENWKTILMNEGLRAGSHTMTYFADRAAYKGYLQMLKDSPILQSLAKPSTILLVLQSVGLALTRGNVRKVIREAMNGTLHSKLGIALHEHFPIAEQPAGARTNTRGIDTNDEAGATEPETLETAGVADEEPDGAEAEPETMDEEVDGD